MIHHRVEFLSHLWTCEIRKYVTCSLNTIVWCKIQVIDIPVKKEKGWKGIKKTHWSQAYLEVQEGNFHWVLRLGNNSVAIGSTIWSQSSDFKSFSIFFWKDCMFVVEYIYQPFSCFYYFWNLTAFFHFVLFCLLVQADSVPVDTIFLRTLCASHHRDSLH